MGEAQIMSMSGIALADGFDLEEFQSLSWAQVRIVNDESFELSHQGTTDSLEEAFSAAGSSLESDTACYVLVQLPADGGWVACLHVPPAAKPRSKMIYSSSFEALKRQLQIRVELSLQGSEPADFTFGEYSARLSLANCREENMTVEERGLRDLEQAELLEAASQAASRSGSSAGGSAGVGLGISEEATAAITGFGSDEALTKLMLRVDLATEKIVLVEPPSAGEPCPLGVTDEQPVFGLLRHHGTTVFVYCCAADCKVRAKMIYSASKGSLVAAAAELGVNVEHRMEADSVAEVTPGALTELIASANAPPPSITAAAAVARPGGKRRSRPPRGS